MQALLGDLHVVHGDYKPFLGSVAIYLLCMVNDTIMLLFTSKEEIALVSVVTDMPNACD